jgi:quercetin dioxygenase-like cupin family protein
MRNLVLIAMVAALSATAYAQPEGSLTVLPDQVEWQEIVPGVEFAAIQGDWTAEAHRKYVRVAGGKVLPNHRHSAGAHIIIISGLFTNTYSEDEPAIPLGAGSYVFIPSGAAHVNTCVSDEPCLLFTTYDAAFDLTIVE